MSYISKYIAKVDDRTKTSLDDDTYQHVTGDESSGRFWGYINKELLPLGEVVAGVLTDRDTIKSLSSLAWAILKNDNPYASLSFHLFCDNARWLCERAIEEGGAWLDEWEYTTRDHTTQDTPPHPYTEHFSEPELSMKPALYLGRKSRPSEASEVQPCTSGWTKRSVLSFPALIKQDFASDGIVVTIVQ